jgi:hypothetical protein
VRDFNLEIKLKACEVLGTIKEISEETLLKALAKEEFDNYKTKKKNKKENEICTSDINFTSENSKE